MIGHADSLHELLEELSETIEPVIEQYSGNPEVKEDFAELLQMLNTSAKTIADGSRRIVTLTQDMGSSFRPNVKRVNTDLVPLIESTIRLVRPGFKPYIKIESTLPEQLMVQCIPSQINQVLMNLMINGCHAIQGKGNKSERAKGQVRVTAEVDDSKIKIHIQDDGTGMSQEVSRRIFEPFFSTKTDGKGSGLGLALSVKLVKAHGGDIQVHSELGQGSTFSIILPRQSPTEAA